MSWEGMLATYILAQNHCAMLDIGPMFQFQCNNHQNKQRNNKNFIGLHKSWKRVDQ